MIEDIDVLARVAVAVKLPDWATHVAVSKVRDNDAEPCAWVESLRDYIDEDPAQLGPGKWSGCYQKAYWHFFSRDELFRFQPTLATV